METSGVTGFLKELGIELVSEFFSLGMLKKIMVRQAAAKVGGEKAKEGDAQPDEIKAGGLFNLSDETAYFGLIAKLQGDPESAAAAHNVSQFLNAKLTEGQKRRFRVVIGSLATKEYVKEVEKSKETIPRAKGAPIIKESSKEVKTNVGLEFLKSFAKYDDAQKMEVCQASGIMDTIFDHIGQGLTSFGEAIKRFEQHPTTQKVMTSLVEKMRAHRQKLNAQRTGGIR